ncbi:hypothetical protein PV332_27505, partial [Streptomyces scabiei]|nr:hypothetical protein [Streptomyces scabiei]
MSPPGPAARWDRADRAPAGTDWGGLLGPGSRPPYARYAAPAAGRSCAPPSADPAAPPSEQGGGMAGHA